MSFFIDEDINVPEEPSVLISFASRVDCKTVRIFAYSSTREQTICSLLLDLRAALQMSYASMSAILNTSAFVGLFIVKANNYLRGFFNIFHEKMEDGILFVFSSDTTLTF